LADARDAVELYRADLKSRTSLDPLDRCAHKMLRLSVEQYEGE